MSAKTFSPPPVFSNTGAQDTAVIVQEAQEWIEEVTGKTFSSSFRECLADGILLCEMIRKIMPGSIPKINKLKSPIAHLDNIQQFLSACRALGMKDSQLFDIMDLQIPKGAKSFGVKRDEADRKIRSVCVTLYWLGRIVADMDSYSGPQLDLQAFRTFIEGTQYSDDNDSNSSPIGEQHNHYQLHVGANIGPNNHTLSPERNQENGIKLTFEQEQTADQLLADIQSAVDEMLQDFRYGSVPEDNVNESTSNGGHVIPSHVGISVHMISRNGGFGFQVVGGADANYHPEVEMVLPDSAAEDAGIKPGDEIVSVNKQDITKMSHQDLVTQIKKAGVEGSVLIGLVRVCAKQPDNGVVPSAMVNVRPDKLAKQVKHEPDFKGGISDVPISSTVPLSRRDPDEHSMLEHEQREKQALEIALAYPTKSVLAERDPPPPVSKPGPTTPITGQALPTLVEYEDEALLDEITAMLEQNPPAASLTPSPPPSQAVPTDLQASITDQVKDDLESIERELEEMLLMEMAASAKQVQERESDQRSQSDHFSSPISDISSSEQKLSIDKQIEELLNFGGQKINKNNSPSEKGEFDRQFDFLLPMLESPPPPKPTTEPPVRQVKKDLPPPAPKPKPKKKIVSLAEATSLTAPATTEVLTKTKRVKSPVENNNRVRSKSTTPTGEKLQFTPPPPPVSPPPKQKPSSPAPPPPKQKPSSPVPPPPKQKPSSLAPPPPKQKPSSPAPPPPKQKPSSSAPPPPKQKPSSPVSPPQKQRPSSPHLPVTPVTAPKPPLEVVTVSPDDVEILGNVKINRVQRIRWTPKGSTTPTVASPIMNPDELLRQQYQKQHWSSSPNSEKQNDVTDKRVQTPSPHPPAQTPFAHMTASSPVKTEPSIQKRSPLQQWVPDGRRQTQPPSMAGWQMPLARDDKMVSFSTNVLIPNQPAVQSRTNWKSQEELRIKPLQLTPTRGHYQPQQRNHQSPVKQQSNPRRDFQQHRAQSLPRGTSDSWRVNRSNTWSAMKGAGERLKDGQQAAHAVQPSSQFELCSRCHQPLGVGTIMSISPLKAQYHIRCFVCRVCRSPLVRSAHDTSVLIKGMYPHCQYCGSDDQGVLTTEC